MDETQKGVQENEHKESSSCSMHLRPRRFSPAKGGGVKILTHFVYPPIPYRSFDWSAAFDGYEPDGLIGYGQTELEAVKDLMGEAENHEQILALEKRIAELEGK